jgi:single-stranded-DNA-specific exonuclease
MTLYTLIITVDNGIQGHNEIKMVQDLGVDVIVTDHHEIVGTDN